MVYTKNIHIKHQEIKCKEILSYAYIFNDAISLLKY